MYLNGVYLQSAVATSTAIVNLSQNTTYNITIKARDAASNLSEFSTTLSTTTLEGPKVLFEEYFEDCNNFNFFAYSEASDKDWGCNDGMYGENNSGSYGINGYLEDVASKDWLITKTPINFDTATGEKISFYTDAAYGTTPLLLVYSSDYDGSSNPANYIWTSVPNVTIPLSNGTSTEVVYTFSDVDINTITGTVYFAFKYYSDGVDPTRWTVDSFEIIADKKNTDTDGDGFLDNVDNCPDTPNPDQADADADADGVGDACDICPGFNDNLDTDGDGVPDGCDICPGSDDTIDTKLILFVEMRQTHNVGHYQIVNGIVVGLILSA